VLKVPLDDPKSLCFRMCFYMESIVCRASKPTLSPITGLYYHL